MHVLVLNDIVLMASQRFTEIKKLSKCRFVSLQLEKFLPLSMLQINIVIRLFK